MIEGRCWAFMSDKSFLKDFFNGMLVNEISEDLYGSLIDKSPKSKNFVKNCLQQRTYRRAYVPKSQTYWVFLGCLYPQPYDY